MVKYMVLMLQEHLDSQSTAVQFSRKTIKVHTLYIFPEIPSEKVQRKQVKLTLIFFKSVD